MSALQQMRQKLDELMGTGRNGTQNPIHYPDPKVCQAEAGGAAAAETQAELEQYGNMVDKKITEVEELGSMGMVVESLLLIREIERLKTKRARLQKYLLRKSSEPVKEQKETICEECQLCIGLDNNEQRLANHSSGRLHHAMLAIRRRITELNAKLQGVSLPRNWARLEVQQQMGMSSKPALVSTRAGSCSPYPRSSSRSRSRPRYTSHSRSRRSYSKARTLTRRTCAKSSSVTRTRCKSHQGISEQQCISEKDDAKSCSLPVSTRDDRKHLLDGTGKSAGPNEKRYAQPQNAAWHNASSNAGRSLTNSKDRKPWSGKPRTKSELTGLPEEKLGMRYPSVSCTKHNLRPKSDTRSRSKSSRSPDCKSSGSRYSKKEKMRTRTKVDARDGEDKSEDENPRGSTARAELGGHVDPGPTPDSKNRIKETRSKAGGGDLKTGHVSSSSPAPNFKKRKVIKRKYRSRGHTSESYEESSNSTSCSEERYSRRDAKGSLKKRKTKRHERRYSTISSESPLRRKPSKKRRARKTVTKKRKQLSSKSDADEDRKEEAEEEKKSRRERRYRSKRKMARRTSGRKPTRKERIKSRKGSRHKKWRKL